MPRLTKAEKMRIAQDEMDVMNTKWAVEYFPLLMASLEEATSPENGFDLRVLHGDFVVSNRSTLFEFTLSSVYSDGAYEDLQSLMHYLERAKEQRRAADKRAEMRTVAMGKLTREEQQLLGL